MKTYEGMFLMDPALASDWPAAEAEIHRILDRAEAKLLGLKSWGERKLAYPIGRWKRGLYVLSFFGASPEGIGGMERDVQLSEKTVRVLILRRDKMTPDAIEKALAAEPPSKVPARGDEWSRRPIGRPPVGAAAGRATRQKDAAGRAAEADGASGKDATEAAPSDEEKSATEG